MNWLFIYEKKNNTEIWSTPKGFADALRSQKINLFEYTFSDPKNVNLPKKIYFDNNKIKVVLIFFAGKSISLESEIKRIKSENEIYIINELGDEPQTLVKNKERVYLSDLTLSPDHRSSLYWQNQGYNCKWFTHWADTKIFYPIEGKSKSKFLITTMGKRKYNFLLKIILGKSYKNKRCLPQDNASFYSTSKVVFQFARWGEITRRIFEASACKCCVLTNRLPDHTMIETLFAENVSILYFDGPFSLIKQLIRIRLRPSLIEMIASNAYQIVQRNHTQAIRAKNLIQLVNNLTTKSLNI